MSCTIKTHLFKFDQITLGVCGRVIHFFISLKLQIYKSNCVLMVQLLGGKENLLINLIISYLVTYTYNCRLQLAFWIDSVQKWLNQIDIRICVFSLDPPKCEKLGDECITVKIHWNAFLCLFSYVEYFISACIKKLDDKIVTPKSKV